MLLEKPVPVKLIVSITVLEENGKIECLIVHSVGYSAKEIRISISNDLSVHIRIEGAVSVNISEDWFTGFRIYSGLLMEVERIHWNSFFIAIYIPVVNIEWRSKLNDLVTITGDIELQVPV